jgi:hypothetical protein
VSWRLWWGDGRVVGVMCDVLVETILLRRGCGG